MTISFEEKTYGITTEEIEQILADEYTTVEPERDNCPGFLDSISDFEEEMNEGINLIIDHDQQEAKILSFYPESSISYNFGGDSA